MTVCPCPQGIPESRARETLQDLDVETEVVVRMEQSNDESIHQHNAHAERVTDIERLRNEVNGTAR